MSRATSTNSPSAPTFSREELARENAVLLRAIHLLNDRQLTLDRKVDDLNKRLDTMTGMMSQVLEHLENANANAIPNAETSDHVNDDEEAALRNNGLSVSL